ncbi:MAG: hypothetical protein COA79_02690 [Planctomycetota bacterium]|nr:MAG: hypothetical protein COA79_02690 [Planctomycetota bacterium]
MKKLALLLLTFVTFGSALMAADVSVSGNLTTQAGVRSDYDFNSDGSGDLGILYADAELNTTVELSDNVKVVLQLELNDKIVTGGTAGALSGDNLDVDEMYLEIGEFFHEALTLKVGHSLIQQSLRKNEKAMYLYLDATAFRLTYALGDEGSVEGFYAKAIESYASVNASTDADVFGVFAEYNFTEDIHAIGYLNHSSWNTGRVTIITVGAGVDAFLLDKKLELFLEAAAQFGEISDTVDHSAFGIDAGARWNFGEVGSLAGAFIELNVGFRTGEDDDADVTLFNNGWSSDEGGVIMENNFDDDGILYAGYAMNSGYLAIRLEGGIDWNEKVKSNMLVAMYNSTSDNVGTFNDENFGIEIDLSSSYQYSENVSFKAVVAVFLADDGLAADADTAVGAAFITDVQF